jgi:predicted house-cleaning noncanonical NTP pyrophosphatase (MazG superfamily)
VVAVTGWRFVKLVRDGIRSYYVPPGEYIYVPVADPQEYAKRLRMKLVEEATEYAVDPSLEELADVITVAEALAERHGGLRAVLAEVERKKQERGSFANGLGMYVKTTGPDGAPAGS